MLQKNKKIIYDYTPVNKVQIHPYELLANAVVERAAEDYRLLRSGRIPTISEEVQLKMRREDIVRRIEKDKAEIVKFFHSKWCHILTKVNMNWMYEKLKQEHHKPWKPKHKHVQVNVERLQEIIREKELSYNRLYQLTGVKGDYYYSLFCGKSIIPLRRFKKIVKGLKVDENELLLRVIDRSDFE